MIRILACLLALSACAPSSAAEQDALLDAAAAHYASAGREQALRDFSHDPGFVRDALYVFCIDEAGTLSASGGFPRMVGMEIDRFEIGGQRGLAALMNRHHEADGPGEVAYQWLNPQSGAMEQKQTRFRRIGQDVCGVGVYTPIAPAGPPRRR